jgi:SsrA-binding protein
VTAKDEEKEPREVIARNKRARFDYHILETWEAGIVLTGTEVKSLREGKATLGDSYAILEGTEVYLINMHISPYDKGNIYNHEPTRTRKLLLHRREIRRLIGAVEQQGLTLVPLELYFRKGRVKVLIAMARGKKLHDKRETAKQKDADREMARVAGRRR